MIIMRMIPVSVMIVTEDRPLFRIHDSDNQIIDVELPHGDALVRLALQALHAWLSTLPSNIPSPKP